MDFQLFSAPGQIILSLLAGFFFGFLLRKGGVSRFDTIIGQLLLKDFTVMKIILTAIVVGSIGIYSLNALGWIPMFHLSKTSIAFALLGGCIFGIGMSLAGYCPGTALAAIGEGSKDMIIGVLGMILASMVYNRFSPTIIPAQEQVDITHEQTLASLSGVSIWAIICLLAIVWVVFAYIIDKVENKG